MNEKQKIFFQRPTVIVLLAVFCCLLWGSATPCIKNGYAMFGIESTNTGSQLLFAGVRFVLAGGMVILVTSFLSGRFLHPTKKSMVNVLELGMVQTVIQYILFYVGLAHCTGVNSSIVQGMNVFIALGIASLLFKMERFTLQKVIGCLVGFSGIVFVNLVGNHGNTGGFSLLGEGFVIGSIIAYGFSSVMVKRFSQKEEPYVLCGYQFLFGGVILILIGLITGGMLTMASPLGLVLLFYMAFISAAAYTIWGLLLKYNPVGKVTIFSCTTPIFGVILSSIFLGEGGQHPVWVVVIALALIVCGILIVNRSKE